MPLQSAMFSESIVVYTRNERKAKHEVKRSALPDNTRYIPYGVCNHTTGSDTMQRLKKRMTIECKQDLRQAIPVQGDLPEHGWQPMGGFTLVYPRHTKTKRLLLHTARFISVIQGLVRLQGKVC